MRLLGNAWWKSLEEERLAALAAFEEKVRLSGWVPPQPYTPGSDRYYIALPEEPSPSPRCYRPSFSFRITYTSVLEDLLLLLQEDVEDLRGQGQRRRAKAPPAKKSSQVFRQPAPKVSRCVHQPQGHTSNTGRHPRGGQRVSRTRARP